MGGPYDALPFPRGQKYSQGVGSPQITLDANFGASIAGNVYRVRDEYGEGRVKLLRAVQNRSGATITTTHRCIPFITTDYDDFGKNVDDVMGAAGDVCKPIDDAYAESFTVAEYDIFYVVEKGVTKVNKPTSGGSGHVALTALYADGDGKVTESTAGIGYIVGRAVKAAEDSDTYEYVDVDEGLGW